MGGIAVGGNGLEVGGTGVAVGVGTGLLHPAKSKSTIPTPVTSCENFVWFMVVSFRRVTPNAPRFTCARHYGSRSLPARAFNRKPGR